MNESSELRIESGWRPGVIGRIIEMHAHYYALDHAFGSDFEVKVAEGLV